MNALLIYPEFPDTFWSFKHALEFVGKKTAKERFQYWKLLLWTQFRCPRLMPDAVILAIYGHHFRKTCERHVT